MTSTPHHRKLIFGCKITLIFGQCKVKASQFPLVFTLSVRPCSIYCGCSNNCSLYSHKHYVCMYVYMYIYLFMQIINKLFKFPNKCLKCHTLWLCSYGCLCVCVLVLVACIKYVFCVLYLWFSKFVKNFYNNNKIKRTHSYTRNRTTISCNTTKYISIKFLVYTHRHTHTQA